MYIICIINICFRHIAKTRAGLRFQLLFSFLYATNVVSENTIVCMSITAEVQKANNIPFKVFTFTYLSVKIFHFR